MNKKKLNKNLNIMYQDMLIQKKIYKPSSFWIHSLNYFLKILKKNGIKNFRREKLATNYFVPLYNHKNEEHITKFIKSYKKNNFSKKMNYLLDSSIDGSLEAFSDYRVFKGADNIKKLPSLHKFSESKFGNPIEQFKFDDKLYSRSALNYLLGLVFLKSKTKNFIPKTSQGYLVKKDSAIKVGLIDAKSCGVNVCRDYTLVENMLNCGFTHILEPNLEVFHKPPITYLEFYDNQKTRGIISGGNSICYKNFGVLKFFHCF